MKITFAQFKFGFMLLILSVNLALVSHSTAQASTFENEQAKLVSKFAKHIGWPEDARQTKFIIGIYKDTDKYKHFNNFFANKGVNDKDILVRLVDQLSRAKDNNILFIPENQKASISSANKTLANSNVLIITENNDKFSESMINISSNKERTKMVFRINDDKLKYTQLTVPDLSYFLDKKNNENILSASPTAVQKSHQSNQLLALNTKLAEKETLSHALNKELNLVNNELNLVNKELSLANKTSAKYKLSLLQEADRLKVIQKENTIKNKKLKILEEQLQENKKMNKQVSLVSDNNTTKELEKSIAELTKQLKNQKKISNNAAINLTNMTEAKNALSNFQLLFYICLFIVIITLALAYVIWSKAKNAAQQPTIPSENDTLLSLRNSQLSNSENVAAFSYIATDITYSVVLTLENIQAQLESAGDTKHAISLKSVVSLLDNFNLIAAGQDDTDIQSFDVIAHTQKMMMLYEFEFSQNHIAYNYSGEKKLTIKSVPTYITLVLLHIINNSLKHGFDNNGNGKIALCVEKEAKNGVKITYSDDGKGMSENTLAQVFEPFFTTRSDRGYLGTGMSTCYNLINNKLGGDIKIESLKGKGTTIVITLP